MFRDIMAAATVLALSTASFGADKAVAIRLRRSQVGEATRESATGKHVMTWKIGDTEGKTVVSVKQEYTDVVLARDQTMPKNVKLRRVYDIAEHSEDDKPRAFELKGKTLLIERKDGTEDIGFADGKPVSVEARRFIEQKAADDVSILEAVFPLGTVKIDEAWKPSVSKVVAMLGQKTYGIDQENSTASAKVTKFYEKDGRQFAAYDLTMEFVITAFRPIPEMKVDSKKSRMVLHFTGNICIDGTSTAADVVGTARSEITGEVDGMPAKLTAVSDSTGHVMDVKK